MIPKPGTHYVPLQANFAGQTEILGHAPSLGTSAAAHELACNALYE
jgi:hypothetical protein